MRQFEYTHIMPKDIDSLNREIETLGARGWELVSVVLSKKPINSITSGYREVPHAWLKRECELFRDNY